MTYQIGIALLPLCVIFIGIAYYFDYKSDPKEFKYSIKTVVNKLARLGTIILIGLVIFMVTKIIFENI